MKTKTAWLVISLAFLSAGLLPGWAAENDSVVKLVAQSQDEAARGNLDAALDMARQAVEKDPAFAEAWKQQGNVLLKKQAYEEAVQSLKTAAQIKPQDAGAWLDLGWAYWSLDRRDEALEALDKAIRGNIPNRERVILQVVARVAEEGRRDKAVEMYRSWEPDGDLLAVGMKLFDMGRIQGALPFLSAAWDAKGNPPVSGLYLAHARALNGRSTHAEQYLEPFVETELEKATPAQLDTLMETFMLCTDNPHIRPLLDKTDAVVKGRRTYETQVTDILQKTAEELWNSEDRQHVLVLYQRILERDPNRKVWIHAYELTQSQEGEEATQAFITNLLGRTTAPSVQQALEGLQAGRKGDSAKAIAYYRQSLEADPQQPEIRQQLFSELVKSGDLDGARREAEWFVQRLENGDGVMRSYLAEIWSTLGDVQKALQFWQMLHLSAPDIGYYGVETAKAMFELCRPDEAIDLLEKMVAVNPYPLAFELLGEIEYAMGRTEKAAEWAAKGLEYQQTPGLLRAYSEYAEMADLNPTSILTAARAFLQTNPGHVPMSLLAGRVMVKAGMTNEAMAFYKQMLERNPDFMPAQLSLRELETRVHQFEDATRHARQTAEQRPWDPEAQRRYAVSLAENDQFHPALKTLRRLGKKKVSWSIPLLAYKGVSDCPYPNRMTVDRILAHLDELAAEGYRFVTPPDLKPIKDEKKAVVLLFDLTAKQVEAVDAKLKKLKGRAVYVGETAGLMHESPGQPGSNDLARMQKSGRWLIATMGQNDLAPRPVNAAGTLGSPLTHALFLPGGTESSDAFSKRIDSWLATAAAALPKGSPKVFVYPGGDYGQGSLDTTPAQVEALRDAVHRHFDYAVAFDESGFVVPGYDALRLPAKGVSPEWSTNDLAIFLKQDDPLVRARFELAKILYWQSQHETANKLYRSGELAGVDPAELYYNWGANAYQQGDYPTAVAMLKKAQELDPQSLRTQNALKKAKDQQRPEVDLRITQWTDNEDRSYLQWGGNANAYLTDTLKLGVLADRNRWEKSDLGDEEGTRLGGQLFWYLREETWFNAELWQLNMDDLRDHTGGLANLHVPNAPLNGFVELQAARNEVETVEALRQEIYANTFAANTYSRLFDDWDLYANFSQTFRSDENETWMADGRLVYRIDEWPFLGIGYLFRFADSDFDPPEYWAPMGLEQHQLYGTMRGAWGPINYSFSGQAGEAREEDTDWNFVWGARARADYRIRPRVSLMGEVNYFEGPVYNRTTWVGGINYNF